MQTDCCGRHRDFRSSRLADQPPVSLRCETNRAVIPRRRRSLLANRGTQAMTDWRSVLTDPTLRRQRRNCIRRSKALFDILRRIFDLPRYSQINTDYVGRITTICHPQSTFCHGPVRSPRRATYDGIKTYGFICFYISNRKIMFSVRRVSDRRSPAYWFTGACLLPDEAAGIVLHPAGRP